MIKLFNSTDTLFSSNGDKIIIPTKAKIRKEDNGFFYLDIETDLSYIDDLVEGAILIAPTPQGEQAFRINNPEKTRSKIKTRCNHVFYDSRNYLINNCEIINKNCNDALYDLNRATDNTSPFTTNSDITTINSYNAEKQSLYESIQSILEIWGGHLIRNNFEIEIKNSIGEDNGVTVRYAKNLKEINSTENWDDVVTKLMPIGKDGLQLPEIYITGETQYSIPYTKIVTFVQNISEEDYQSEEDYHNALIIDLRNQATEYISQNSLPKINYTLKANIEKITDIGDTIQVIDERLRN